MVSSAELEKKMVLEQQTQLQKENDQNQVELHAKLEKLEVLEKECLKLTATQIIAEDKIKHLEEKLFEEEHQHKLLQAKAAQVTFGLLGYHSPEEHSSKRPKSKKHSDLLLKEQSNFRYSQPHFTER
uniref:Cep57 centrosome localisation domain-containing protein n=1 Tax=Anas platyrhynchos TaxID=8839 RepID=A0A8B9SUB8_ANAPL